MPSRNHSMRFPDPLWDEAGAILRRRGSSRNAYAIRAFENLRDEDSWQSRFLEAEARALAAEAELRRIKGEQ